MKFYTVAAAAIRCTVRGQLCRRVGETFIDCIRNVSLTPATDGIVTSQDMKKK